MPSLDDFFGSHPLESRFRAGKRARCIAAFSNWLTEASFTDWHLALYAFCQSAPLNLHSADAINDALAFFREHPSLTWEAIAKHSLELSHAITTLIRPAPSWTNDDTLSLDSPEEAAAFDSVWHPEYQRYTEHILNHIIQIPLFVLGWLKNKDYTSPALSVRADCLVTHGLQAVTAGFDAIVRNAIAHGHIEYGLADIKYTDKGKVKQLAAFEFSELFDRLVDTCHALVAAILLFIGENKQSQGAPASSDLPFGIRNLVTVGLATHPALSIISMLETRSAGAGVQLHVVCRTSNPSRGSHQFDSLYIAWLSSKLYPAYDRYVISIDSGRPSHSTVAIDGNVMSESILQQQDIDVCASRLIEGSLLWYDAPHWQSTLSTFKTLLRANWPNLLDELRSIAERSGLVEPICQYRIIRVENNSTRSVPRINCYASLLEAGTITDTKLLATLRHIIRALRRKQIRRSDMYGPKGLPTAPTHATVRLFVHPARLRTLKAQTWASHNLVLIAEWAKNPHSAKPFYTKQADFIRGPLRVRYNPALKSTVSLQSNQ